MHELGQNCRKGNLIQKLNGEKIGRVLIVDDETEILNIAQLILSKHVDYIATANSGIEAYHKIKNENFDCIVSDIQMDMMSGMELIEKVRGDNFDIRFIFFTGYGSDQYLASALKYGAFDFISKNDLDSLCPIVMRAIKESLHLEKGTEEDALKSYKSLLLDIKNKNEA